MRASIAGRVLSVVLLVLLTPVAAQDSAPLLGPSEDTIPEGPLGDAIRLGQKILTHTPTYAAQYSGSARQNCWRWHSSNDSPPSPPGPCPEA